MIVFVFDGIIEGMVGSRDIEWSRISKGQDREAVCDQELVGKTKWI